ncbi:MAG: hypothetical protein AB1454_03305 [Candidatus Auribacterota bacterium]|uniref:Uncharacterized protein n=1 Tax=Candidatus Auribacter fodinae TaxID=2093366 RepID=A0A3A4QT44_9BACT|nr:MAG: hypothetical protein C4541_11090 [Candidatus Auribacter fodinae]
MDSETRSELRRMRIGVLRNLPEQIVSELELVIDAIFDRAYRKGWDHGYWKQDADLSYQTYSLKRRKK